MKQFLSFEQRVPVSIKLLVVIIGAVLWLDHRYSELQEGIKSAWSVDNQQLYSEALAEMNPTLKVPSVARIRRPQAFVNHNDEALKDTVKEMIQ